MMRRPWAWKGPTGSNGEGRVNGAKQASPRVRGKFSRLGIASVAAAGAAVGLVAAVYLDEWPQRLCDRLQGEVEAAPPEQIAPLLDRLIACGSPSLPALAALLGSSRPEVADAVYDALRPAVRRPASDPIPTDDSLLPMAEALAHAAQALEPTQRGRHAALALELLEAAGRKSLADGEGRPGERRRILLLCQELLQSTPSSIARTSVLDAPLDDSRREDDESHAAPEASESTSAFGLVPGPAMQPISNAARSDAAPLSNPLPNDTTHSPSPIESGPFGLGPATIRSEPAATAVKANVGAANAGAVVVAPQAAAVQPAAFSTDVASPRSLRPPVEPPGSVEAASADRSAAAGRASAWELFDDLVSTDAARVVVARHELARRRFSAAEIELGRRFAVADAAERRRLVETLPSQPDVDLRPWLLHFSTDDDAAVRTVALSIMATTGDPHLLDRVKQAAFYDSDDEVRRTSRRLLDSQSR